LHRHGIANAVHQSLEQTLRFASTKNQARPKDNYETCLAAMFALAYLAEYILSHALLNKRKKIIENVFAYISLFPTFAKQL